MPNTPLNPDALMERIAGIIDSECQSYDAAVRGSDEILYGEGTDLPKCAAEKIMALIRPNLAAAQPVVNSVEVIPAKMRMLAWEGGEFEIGEIPEGHVLVGFEMATDRAWSMADKVTIHIERKDTTNGR